MLQAVVFERDHAIGKKNIERQGNDLGVTLNDIMFYIFQSKLFYPKLEPDTV